MAIHRPRAWSTAALHPRCAMSGWGAIGFGAAAATTGAQAVGQPQAIAPSCRHHPGPWCSHRVPTGTVHRLHRAPQRVLRSVHVHRKCSHHSDLRRLQTKCVPHASQDLTVCVAIVRRCGPIVLHHPSKPVLRGHGLSRLDPSRRAEAMARGGARNLRSGMATMSAMAVLEPISELLTEPAAAGFVLLESGKAVEYLNCSCGLFIALGS